MHAVTPEDINSANTGSKNQPIFKSHYLAVFLFFGRKKRGGKIERYTISHILTARKSAGGEIKTIWALTPPHVQGQPVLPAMKVGPGHFARMLGDARQQHQTHLAFVFVFVLLCLPMSYSSVQRASF